MRCPVYNRPDDSVTAVPIIDADQMKNVLNLLRGGQEARFSEFLMNPLVGKLHYITGNYVPIRCSMFWVQRGAVGFGATLERHKDGSKLVSATVTMT